MAGRRQRTSGWMIKQLTKLNRYDEIKRKAEDYAASTSFCRRKWHMMIIIFHQIVHPESEKKTYFVQQQSSYSFAVCSLVLCSIWGVTEELHAFRIKTGVRTFARVWPSVNLQVFKPRKRLVATVELQTDWHENKYVDKWSCTNRFLLI